MARRPSHADNLTHVCAALNFTKEEMGHIATDREEWHAALFDAVMPCKRPFVSRVGRTMAQSNPLAITARSIPAGSSRPLGKTRFQPIIFPAK
jgi:hypothetical protein